MNFRLWNHPFFQMQISNGPRHRQRSLNSPHSIFALHKPSLQQNMDNTIQFNSTFFFFFLFVYGSDHHQQFWFLPLTDFSIRTRSSSRHSRCCFVNGVATPFLLNTTRQSPTFATWSSPFFTSTLAAQAPLPTPCNESTVGQLFLSNFQLH